MGLFDLFTQQPAAPAAPATPAAPTPAEPGNIPPPNSGTGTNAAPGSGGSAPDTSNPPADDSPLANFKDLWEPVKTDPATPPAGAPKELNADDVRKAISKVNFAETIGADTLAQISAGGEEAQAAFAKAMNSVAQQVMVQSTLVNNKLAEKAIEDALKRQMETLPGMLREQSIKNHSLESNPLFKSPAVKPIFEATQKQLAQKFPDSSPAEITQMTKEYIIAMGEAFGPPKVKDDSSEGGTNWETFLNS